MILTQSLFYRSAMVPSAFRFVFKYLITYSYATGISNDFDPNQTARDVNKGFHACLINNLATTQDVIMAPYNKIQIGKY